MKRKITGGLYLVVNPAIPNVYETVARALEGGVDVIQLWNNWPEGLDRIAEVNRFCQLAHAFNVPVIVHEEWELLLSTHADGVHFDEIPMNWSITRMKINRPFSSGFTCGNDDTVINKGIAMGFDYLSFCAMYPSSSVSSCELVTPERVLETRHKTTIPIFASGGISTNNMHPVLKLGVNGVAVISAISKAEDPTLAARQFKERLNNLILL